MQAFLSISIRRDFCEIFVWPFSNPVFYAIIRPRVNRSAVKQ